MEEKTVKKETVADEKTANNEIVQEEQKKKGKKKKVIIGIFILVVIAIIAFLIWFFNRKFPVVYDFNNGTTEEIMYIKYNKGINKDEVKDQEELGDSFIGWFEVTYNEKNEEVIAEKEFDFTTKIKEKRKLKALYKGAVETIKITFDSRGGSKVNSITINKGSKLTLPNNPTRNGYKFIAWKDKNEVPIGSGALLSEDTTLYAYWEKIETAKPVETISLSVTNKYVTNQGTITTSKAVAKTANTNDNPKYTLNDTECANINETTGEVTVRTNINWRMPYYRKCYFDGTTLTVTATLPSGKSATAQIIIEPRLKVNAFGIDNSYGAADGATKPIEAYSPHTDFHLYYFTDRPNTYTANQPVTWTAQIHSSIGVSKTDKTYTYTFNNNSSRDDITVSATTAAGQTTTIKSSQLVN